MRTWLWKNKKDWAHNGIWIIVVELERGRHVAFSTSGELKVFDHPFNRSLNLWEEVE